MALDNNWGNVRLIYKIKMFITDEANCVQGLRVFVLKIIINTS